MKNWDDAFSNADYIKDAEKIFESWCKDAKAFREEKCASSDLNIRYGSHEREVYDRFYVDNPHGVVVFVHGGYWQEFDKSYWSHFARGAWERGYDVCIPSYPLCPEVKIHQITKSISKMIAQINTRAPIYLVGHSAGGHLVARMNEKGLLPDRIFERVRHIVPISAIADLRPLLLTRMNQNLVLDAQEARTESPALLEVRPSKVTLWVGENERPEFLRQSAVLDLIWRGLDVDIQLVIEEDKHHFDVIDGLKDPHSRLLQTLLDV